MSTSGTTLGVCIFALNEEVHIQETLASVTAWQNHNGNVTEICVVDDGSTDSTAFLVEEAMQSNSSIQLIRHTVNRGPTEALRTGLENLTTDYVLLLPGDHTYDQDAISRLLMLWREQTSPLTLILGTRTSTRLHRSKTREAAADLALLPFRIYATKGGGLPSVGLILFPRVIGLLMPSGVVGYGQGIGLLGTMLVARIPISTIEVDQVIGSESRGSRLTPRKVWDVFVTHWSLLFARKQILRSTRKIATYT